MPLQVYSTLFIAAQGVDVNTGYVVPAGKLAVVRDVEAVAFGSPTDTAVSVFDAATNSTITYHLFLNPFEEHHWEGRQVVEPGATITAQTAGSQDVSVRVSGYLLTLP